MVPAEVEQEWIPHIGGSGAGQSWLIFRDVGVDFLAMGDHGTDGVYKVTHTLTVALRLK